MRTIPTPEHEAGAVAVDSQRHLVYIGWEASSGGAMVFDEASRTVTPVGGTTNNSTKIAVVEKTGYAYVTDGDGFVSVLSDTKLLRTFGVSAAYWVTVDQRTGLVYVGVEDGVDVFRGLSLLKFVPVGGRSVSAAVDSGTGFVYVPVPSTGKVRILRDRHSVSTVKVGDDPHSVSVDRSNHEAYVAEGDAKGAVAVIKGDSTSLAKTIRVSSDPTDSAVVSRTHHVYVANSGDGTVSVIKGHKVVATDTVGEYDSQLVADPANGVVLATDGDSEDGDAVWALHGDRTLGRVPISELSLYTGFDRSNGRAFVTGNGGDLFELQTPTATRITISRPVAGHRYAHGTHAAASYTCRPGKNNTVTSCDGSVPSGSRLPHGRGRHTFVVRARSPYGRDVTTTVHYRVAR